MKTGVAVEAGPVREVFGAPRHGYTRVGGGRQGVRRRAGGHAVNLISVENVSFGYSRDRLVLDGVSLAIRPGASVGLVGRIRIGQDHPAPAAAGAGPGRSSGADPLRRCDARCAQRRLHAQLSPARFRQCFRTPSPRSIRARNVLGIVLGAIALAGHSRQPARAGRGRHWFRSGSEPGILGRYPHEFSGRQRQRICHCAAPLSPSRDCCWPTRRWCARSLDPHPYRRTAAAAGGRHDAGLSYRTISAWWPRFATRW